MRYFVHGEDETVEVDLDPDRVRVNGREVGADLSPLPGTALRTLLVDGASHRLVVRSLSRGRWEIHVRGHRLEFEVEDERTRRIRRVAGIAATPRGPQPVSAPMPGLVVQVAVDEGERVTPGQALVIVEAMKMENELRAEDEGRVRAVHVVPGDTVEKGEILIEFEPLEDEGD